MGYEVVVEELRTAAGSYERTVGDMASYDLDATNVAADTFGHVELAAWFSAVAEQCDNAGQALHDGATGLAASLRAQATTYEGTDANVGATFGPGLSPLLGEWPR